MLYILKDRSLYNRPCENSKYSIEALSYNTRDTGDYSRLDIDILLSRWLSPEFHRLYLQDENGGFKFFRNVGDRHKTAQSRNSEGCNPVGK
jgi:hypothetical protein